MYDLLPEFLSVCSHILLMTEKRKFAQCFSTSLPLPRCLRRFVRLVGGYYSTESAQPITGTNQIHSTTPLQPSWCWTFNSFSACCVRWPLSCHSCAFSPLGHNRSVKHPLGTIICAPSLFHLLVPSTTLFISPLTFYWFKPCVIMFNLMIVVFILYYIKMEEVLWN